MVIRANSETFGGLLIGVEAYRITFPLLNSSDAVNELQEKLSLFRFCTTESNINVFNLEDNIKRL